MTIHFQFLLTIFLLPPALLSSADRYIPGHFPCPSWTKLLNSPFLKILYKMEDCSFNGNRAPNRPAVVKFTKSTFSGKMEYFLSKPFSPPSNPVDSSRGSSSRDQATQQEGAESELSWLRSLWLRLLPYLADWERIFRRQQYWMKCISPVFLPTSFQPLLRGLDRVSHQRMSVSV
jgi:hypothetical protein